MNKNKVLYLFLILNLSSCANVSNFNSYKSENAGKITNIVIYAPSNSYASSREQEYEFCSAFLKEKVEAKCTSITANMPPGKQIDSNDVLSLSDKNASNHIVILQLSGADKTITHQLVTTDYSSNIVTSEKNNFRHLIQVLSTKEAELAYSAEIESSDELSLSRKNYYKSLFGKIVMDWRKLGLL
ncbi:hypothetical protein [Rheinheimera fenheensis]|uniref:hypothetical protein n=1 Tax=Rheinheimera fenheensis TaxID=3152295 RepID=UPI003260A3FA